MAMELPCAPGTSASAARAWRRQAQVAWGFFERLTFAYLACLNLLIALFHANLPRAWLYFYGHLVMAAGILTLIFATHHSSNHWLRFLRHWYPLTLFLFFFEELHYLTHLVFPGWFDLWLIQFDYALLGVHPTVWFEQFATPVRNDLLQFTYMTYYLFPVLLCGVLYWRSELHAFWVVMNSTAAAYYLGYIIALLFPIEGPYHTLAPLYLHELVGGAVTSLINWIEALGRVHGAAFPSAHVSGSFVVILGAWRYRRWLFYALLPFFLGMLVATVYGRYHYVADVLAGLLVGAVAFCTVSSFSVEGSGDDFGKCED